MATLQKLGIRRSEIKSCLGDLATLDTLADEQKAETDRLTKKFREMETQYRAAVIAEGESRRADSVFGIWSCVWDGNEMVPTWCRAK